MLKKNDFQPGILPTQIINQAWGRRIKTILDRLKTNVLSYSAGGQRSEMGLTGRKSVSRAAFLPGLQGDAVPFPCLASYGSRLHALACDLCLHHLQSQRAASSNVSLILALLPPSYKDPMITLGPHGQSRKISPSGPPDHSCKVPFHRYGNVSHGSQGLACGPLWRSLLCLSYKASKFLSPVHPFSRSYGRHVPLRHGSELKR